MRRADICRPSLCRGIGTEFDTASTNSACTAATGSASVINVVGDGPFSYAWTGSASTAGTASNVSAGVYVCTITDVNGCSTPVTVIVNAMNAPTVTLQSQSDVTCFGGSDGAAAVSVGGGSSPYVYAWSNSTSTSNAISNVSAGTYTCTVSDVASCEAFLVVTIAQPAALDSTISVSGMTFTANETTSGVTYQWIDCGNGNAPIVGQTGQSFTATQPGNYAVIVTLNSCSVTSDCELTTGVSDGQENTIRLYPNPNSGHFTVASSEDGLLEVFSMTGQLLLHQAISNGETSVSLSGQARGTYLVRITCGENTTHKRIVIQ